MFHCFNALRDCGRVGLIALSVGPGVVEAVVSVSGRLWEEYGVDCIGLVYTSRSIGLAGKVKDLLAKFMPRIKVIDCYHTGEPGIFERALRKLIEQLCGILGSKGVVLVPTPGSRRLAAAMGMAGVGRGYGAEECNVDIIHVDFYWGPWSGLIYPFVPRFIEPILLINPVHGPMQGPRSLHVEDSVLGDYLGRLPPLRRSIALLAYRLNELAYRVQDEVKKCGVGITLSTGGWRIVVNDVCDMAEWVGAIGEAEKLLDERLASLAGLCALFVEADNITRLTHIDEPVVIDTNLVYYGVHTDTHEGAKVVLPYCAQAELLIRYAEALKPGKRDIKSLLDRLVGLALEELRYAGVRILASPPPPCDTAIPSIDPLSLENVVLVTADKGAYQLWSSHPVSRLAKLGYAKTEPLTRLAKIEPPETIIARASYSLLQATVVMLLQGHNPIINVESRKTRREIVVSEILEREEWIKSHRIYG